MPNYAASEINVKKFISAYIIVQLTPRNAYRIYPKYSDTVLFGHGIFF